MKEYGKTREELREMISDLIYLNKRGRPSETAEWAYYRITSQGNERDDIPAVLNGEGNRGSYFSPYRVVVC
jgi:hypothetical protein